MTSCERRGSARAGSGCLSTGLSLYRNYFFALCINDSLSAVVGTLPPTRLLGTVVHECGSPAARCLAR